MHQCQRMGILNWFQRLSYIHYLQHIYVLSRELRFSNSPFIDQSFRMSELPLFADFEMSSISEYISYLILVWILVQAI